MSQRPIKSDLSELSIEVVDALEALEKAVWNARHNTTGDSWHEYNVQLIHIRSALVSAGWCKTLNKPSK